MATGATELPNDLTITVRLGLRDARWAIVLALLNRTLLTIFAIVACGEVYIAVSQDNPGQIYIGVLIIVFVYGAVPWIQAIVSRRSSLLRFPIRHTFSSRGISSQLHGATVALDWTLVQSARETNRYIGVWGKRGGPMLIPKKQIGESDLASLRRILQYHLQTKAKFK